MKKRDSSEKTQVVPANSPNVLTSSADEKSIFDALRSENLQLLEDKLSQEQQLNKLNLELTLLKEHQTKTEDYESIQEQLLQTTKENQENVDLIASKHLASNFLVLLIVQMISDIHKKVDQCRFHQSHSFRS